MRRRIRIVSSDSADFSGPLSEAMLKRGEILRECASSAPKAQKDDSPG